MPEAVAAIRALADKATLGPWRNNDHWSVFVPAMQDLPVATANCGMVRSAKGTDQISRDQAAANAAYIAAVSPDVVLAFLKRIEALEAENAGLREALEPFADQAATFDSSDKGEFVSDRFEPAFVDHTIGDLRRARTALNQRMP